MDAREFMQGHAAKACEGRIPEIMGDLTPEALAQLGPLMAGAPNPLKTNTVVPVSQNGGDHIFDVTYTGRRRRHPVDARDRPPARLHLENRQARKTILRRSSWPASMKRSVTTSTPSR